MRRLVVALLRRVTGRQLDPAWVEAAERDIWPERFAEVWTGRVLEDVPVWDDARVAAGAAALALSAGLEPAAADDYGRQWAELPARDLPELADPERLVARVVGPYIRHTQDAGHST